MHIRSGYTVYVSSNRA